MIDTIKFLVPIDDILALRKLSKRFTEFKKEDLETNKIEFVFHNKKFEFGSFNRNIMIKISESYPSGLFIEFSIPKYKKGNNVEMIKASELKDIINKFSKELSLKLDFDIPDYNNWEIYRLDVCYNWIFKDLEEAKSVISFLQRIDFPRKKKHLYDTSVMYVGSAYTIKFYLKGPEFKKHDFKDLEKLDLRMALELQEWANKILRFEIGFKKNYLRNLLNEEKTTIDSICSNELIEDILSTYLKDKILKYVTTKNINEQSIEERIFEKFKKTKGLRLLQFYKSFYLEEGSIKQRILSGGLNRSTIWRYKKELKDLNIRFDIPFSNNSKLLEELVIPSKNSKFDLIEYMGQVAEDLQKGYSNKNIDCNKNL